MAVLWACTAAVAQPFAIAPRSAGVPGIEVFNLATYERVGGLALPESPIAAVVAPDNRAVFLAGTGGFVRVSLPGLDTLAGVALPSPLLWLPRDGRHLYALDTTGRLTIFDASPLATASTECCEAVSLAFSPDGAVRYTLRRSAGGSLTLTATRLSGGTMLWSTTVPGDATATTLIAGVDARNVYVSRVWPSPSTMPTELMVRDAGTGTERSTISFSAQATIRAVRSGPHAVGHRSGF